MGHDRGGRVGHRLGLDHPERVPSLAVLDIVPTLHMFENVDRAMAESYFHWFFLTQPGGLPERLIEADPAAWIASRFAGRHAGRPPVDDEIQAAYLEASSGPALSRRPAPTTARPRRSTSSTTARTAMRPGLERRVLALWGESQLRRRATSTCSASGGEYAADVAGASVPADHYLAEEAPAATVEAIRAFWGSGMTPAVARMVSRLERAGDGPRRPPATPTACGRRTSRCVRG